MSRDWRNDHAYDHFDDLDLSGLAWECLRRNATYRADYERKRQDGGVPSDWGLRFPCRSGLASARRFNLLAPRNRARRRHTGCRYVGAVTAICQARRQNRRAPHRRPWPILGAFA